MAYLIKVLCCSTVLFIYTGLVQAVVVIQYHHVDTETPAATSISPELFAQHMNYLASHGFQVWPLPRLIKLLKQGDQIPDKAIAITFDDGYRSVYRYALPIMQKHQFPFTIFINPDLVGGSGYMNWDELRKLATQGATIASHTATHPHLVRQFAEESATHWEHRIQNEMAKAEDDIRKHIGHSPRLLAYPYGEYNGRVQTLARNFDLIAFAQHSGAFDQGVNWQAVPRFAFGGQYTGMEGFIDKVNSLPMPLTEALVSDGQGQRLEEPLLPLAITRPTLTLRLKTPGLAQRVRCFASGQGRIDVRVNGNTVTTRPRSALPVGRSRINCTAASKQQGRFYWYSSFFMRKRDNGSWYQEP